MEKIVELLQNANKRLAKIEELFNSIDWKLPDRGLHALRHRPDNSDKQTEKH